MRIIFVSHDSRLYGAEKSLLSLVSGLPPQIVPLVVVPRRGLLTAALKQINIPVKIIKTAPWTGARFLLLQMLRHRVVNLMAVSRLTHLCRRFKANLIYSNTIACPAGAAAAYSAGIPHVWHIREYAGFGQAARFCQSNKTSINFVNRTTCHVIYNSESVARHYRNAGITVDGQVVYNGINSCAEPVAFGSKRQPVFLVAGSLNKHKNQEEAIEAFSIVCGRIADAKLIIAGEGSRAYRKYLEDIVHRKGFDGKVTFEGYVKDIKPLFNRACALIMCSRREPWGRILAEAMACGCPVIASDAGGASEIVENEKTGLLYPPGNASACAELMIKTANGGPGISEMTAKAVLSIKTRFSVYRYRSEILNVLSACIEHARTGGAA